MGWRLQQDKSYSTSGNPHAEVSRPCLAQGLTDQKDGGNFWGTETNSGHLVLRGTLMNRTLMMKSVLRGLKLSGMGNSWRFGCKQGRGHSARSLLQSKV